VSEARRGADEAATAVGSGVARLQHVVRLIGKLQALSTDGHTIG
jgi:hypothetical protein